MIYTISIFLMGLLIGPFVVLTIGQLLPDRWSSTVATFCVSTGIKMGHRWLVIDKGGGDYELKMSTRTDDDDGEIVGDDVYPDGAGLMGRLFGKPFGVTYTDHAVVTSPLVSAIGREYGELKADGGLVDPNERRPVSWYQENAVISRHVDRATNRVYEVVNGCVTVPDRAVANVRDTVNLLSKSGDPGVAFRAATNAEQSEVARKGNEGWKQAAGKFAYLMMGGLLVYIGTAGGGGGGGAREAVEGTVVGGGATIMPYVDVLAVVL